MKIKRAGLALCVLFFVLFLCSCDAQQNPVTPPDVGNTADGQTSRTAEGENPRNVPAPSSEPVPPEEPVPPQTTTAPPTQTPAPPPAEPHLLGEFETPILNTAEDRITNLKLACQKINQFVVEPGEEFSFNDTVGERTEERGFKEGIVFEGKKKKKAVGGGVCQVSSTLFNAARNADLVITERHQHKREVKYVKLGDDATVAYGELDFRFKNTQNRPVKIEAFLTNSAVYVGIWAL